MNKEDEKVKSKKSRRDRRIYEERGLRIGKEDEEEEEDRKQI